MGSGHCAPWSNSQSWDDRSRHRQQSRAAGNRHGCPSASGRAVCLQSVPEPDGRLQAIWSLHAVRSEEHTSELQSLMRISYAVFCLKKTQLFNTTITHQKRETI